MLILNQETKKNVITAIHIELSETFREFSLDFTLYRGSKIKLRLVKDTGSLLEYYHHVLNTIEGVLTNAMEGKEYTLKALYSLLLPTAYTQYVVEGKVTFTLDRALLRISDEDYKYFKALSLAPRVVKDSSVGLHYTHLKWTNTWVLLPLDMSTLFVRDLTLGKTLAEKCIKTKTVRLSVELKGYTQDTSTRLPVLTCGVFNMSVDSLTLADESLEEKATQIVAGNLVNYLSDLFKTSNIVQATTIGEYLQKVTSQH